MRSIIGGTIVAITVVAFAAPVAEARNSKCDNKGVVYSYLHWYRHAKKLHGTRAPGRQILRFGLKSGKPSACRHLKRSTVVLKRMNMPTPAVRYVTTGSPYVPPAQTATIHAGSTLEAIAQCESGGNPSAVDPSGTYRGKYQFDIPTWQSVGGSGDPAAASEAEQDRRAAMLYARSGSAPWPVCGR